MSSQSQGADTRRPVRPKHAQVTQANVDAGVVGEEVEVGMEERAEELMRRITELEEKIVREEGRRPTVSPVPHHPTQEEVDLGSGRR